MKDYGTHEEMKEQHEDNDVNPIYEDHFRGIP